VDGNDSVDGTSWLSGLTADGGSHTLYVALLDQGSNVLATDNHSFTYQSGDGSTQSPTGGTGGGSGDSISITALGSYADQNTDLQVTIYQSSGGGYQTPHWAYRIGSSFPGYGSPHGGTEVYGSEYVYDFLSGQSDGFYNVYVALLDQSGNLLNPPVTDSQGVNYQYQSSTGGTQSGGGDYQTPTSGTQSPDSIYILYPNVETLYESNGNGLTVSWYYQSSYNASQSVSWAYKLDGGSYSSPVTGADSVNGSTWLSGLTADGGNHTLYVALLDQNTGNQLATDNHSFTYQSGDGSTQSPSGGTGGGSGDRGYKSPGDG